MAMALAAGCGPDQSDRPGPPQSAASALIQKALPAFEEARGRRFLKPSPSMARLRNALRSRNGRLAQQLAQQELATDPDNPEALLISSQLLYQSAAMTAARPGFERILELGPTFEGCQRVFYLYGSCLLRLGEPKAAREAFEGHLRLDPEHGETHYSLGELILQDGDPEASLPHFERALELFQTSRRKQGPFLTMDLARVHASIAAAHLQAGDLKAARQSIERSLELNPNHPQSHYTLSRILTRLGDMDGARAALAEFQRLNQATAPGGQQR